MLAPKSGVVRHVPVRIIIPSRYPDQEPKAYDYTDRFLPHDESRHFYRRETHGCLWLPWDSEWDGNKSEALLDFIAHVVIFFNHQILFDLTGKWPVPSRAHGRAGYREFLVETLGIPDVRFEAFVPLLLDGPRVAYLPCPCGSGRHSKWCHLLKVNELISKIGWTELREYVIWIISASESRGDRKSA